MVIHPTVVFIYCLPWTWRCWYGKDHFCLLQLIDLNGISHDKPANAFSQWSIKLNILTMWVSVICSLMLEMTQRGRAFWEQYTVLFQQSKVDHFQNVNDQNQNGRLAQQHFHDMMNANKNLSILLWHGECQQRSIKTHKWQSSTWPSSQLIYVNGYQNLQLQYNSCQLLLEANSIIISSWTKFKNHLRAMVFLS